MQRRKLIIDLINKDDHEISKFVCVEPGTLKLQEYNFKKLGGQAFHWWEKGLEEYWAHLQEYHYKCYKGEKLNPKLPKQIEAIKIAAERHWGLEEEIESLEQYLNPEEEKTEGKAPEED